MFGVRDSEHKTWSGFFYSFWFFNKDDLQFDL